MELRDLKRIEKQCGIKFKRIGPPQMCDKVDAAVDMARERILNVDEKNIELFSRPAEELVKTLGPVKGLAAALSFLAGYSEQMEARSLLASLVGYKTIQITGQRPIFSPRFVLNFLARFDEKMPVKGIRLCEDGSAVADVPVGLADMMTSPEVDTVCIFFFSHYY